MTKTLHQRPGPLREASDTGNDQNQARENENEITPDDPFTVRNGDDLLTAASDALQVGGCRLATVHPQGQPFYLHCLHRTWNEVLGLVAICQRKSGNPDCWFGRAISGHWNRVTYLPSGPPPGLSIGRFVLSPRIIELWTYLRTHELEGPSGAPSLAHYTVFQGSTGASNQRFMMSWTVSSALASVFFALANGFELVVAATVLASEAKFLDSAELRCCNDCNELFAVKAIQDVAQKQSRHKRRVGIIF